MMRKLLAVFLAALLPLTLAACSGGNGDTFIPSGTLVETVATEADAFDADDYFEDAVTGEDPVDEPTSEDPAADESSADDGALTAAPALRTETEQQPVSAVKTGGEVNASVTLSGSVGILSDESLGSSGSQVVLSVPGTYTVTGSSDGVTILIDDGAETGTVYLVLDNVTMVNADTACICVNACDKLVIRLVGENSLTSSNPSESETVDGAVYSKDDLTLTGSGSLTVTSARHGIVCNDDLKITGGVLTVNAEAIGIKAGDSLKIGGGELTVTAGHDGIQVENDEGDSRFYMEDGLLTVNAGYDGIQVSGAGSSFTGDITLAGGTLDLTAGGGASRQKNDSLSQKGIKCQGDVYIGGVTLTVSSADDAVHSNTSVSVTDGTLLLSSSDDGIHADSALSISGGKVTVSRSYEGLEAYAVTVSGGEVSITASDDGINAAGGSDSASTERGPWGSSSSGVLTVSGGYVYVNANGDGLDSNGSLYVTGGLIIVEGPTNSGNGALDKGEGGNCVASITGGTVLAIGAAGMAVNFDSGSQCSGLVNLSGSAGTLITAEDGSGFSFTASKAFSCIVYSSPSMSKGSSYTLTAGNSSATMDFSSGYYYSASGKGGGMGMGGGMPGGMGGGMPGGQGGMPGGRR